MLLASEFTVGKVGSAKPISLVLPSNKYEEAMIVGQIGESVAAVFLSGQYKSCLFESEGNENWGGLIVPDVGIEIDETSFVDTSRSDAPMLSVIRTGARLAVVAKRENSFRSELVTLHENLASAGEFHAVFTDWRVVLGDGQIQRTIWSVP